MHKFAGTLPNSAREIPNSCHCLIRFLSFITPEKRALTGQSGFGTIVAHLLTIRLQKSSVLNVDVDFQPDSEVNKELQHDEIQHNLCYAATRHVCLQGPQTYLGNHIEISLKKNFDESHSSSLCQPCLTGLNCAFIHVFIQTRGVTLNPIQKINMINCDLFCP